MVWTTPWRFDKLPPHFTNHTSAHSIEDSPNQRGQKGSSMNKSTSLTLRLILLFVFAIHSQAAFGQTKKKPFWNLLPTSKKTVKRDSNIRKASWTDRMKLPSFGAQQKKTTNSLKRFNNNVNRQTKNAVQKTKNVLMPWTKPNQNAARKPEPRWSADKGGMKNPFGKLFASKPKEPELPQTLPDWISQDRPGF